MSKNQGYNGYTNYETWAVKLWIDNDQGAQEYWLEQATEAASGAMSTGDLADMLKAEHEEALPALSGFAADLMNAAMSEVNWYELAEDLIRDAAEQ